MVSGCMCIKIRSNKITNIPLLVVVLETAFFRFLSPTLNLLGVVSVCCWLLLWLLYHHNHNRLEQLTKLHFHIFSYIHRQKYYTSLEPQVKFSILFLFFLGYDANLLLHGGRRCQFGKCLL